MRYKSPTTSAAVNREVAARNEKENTVTKKKSIPWEFWTLVTISILLACVIAYNMSTIGVTEN